VPSSDPRPEEAGTRAGTDQCAPADELRCLDGMKLNVSLRSNVISAVLARVIYLIIYFATIGFAFSRLIAPRLR
jgi:hypothetical protein